MERKLGLEEKLHSAIQTDCLDIVKQLVGEGANMDHVLGMRGTALCAAIEARNFDIAKYLIKAGCDVNARDFDGEPPLLLALRKERPLSISLKKAAVDIAKILIDNKKCNVNKVDPLTKKTALHFVTEQGMKEVVDWLLLADCDMNKIDANGNTALHLAVHNGNFEIAKKLVADPRCLVKVYNNAGLVPFHIPCNNGNLRCLQTIIEQIKLKHKSRTKYMHHEIENNPDRDSELYLNVNAETKFEKDTCLHVAARNFYSDITNELIKNGAKLCSKNNLGQQPIILACSANEHWAKKNNSVPEILLNAGADPNVKGCVRNRYLPRDTEVTPLIVAAKNNNLEFAKLLVKKGADINLCDSLGQTPVYHALHENSKAVARFLLIDCPEINVNIKDYEGNSCLDAVLKCKKTYPGELSELVQAIFRAGGELQCDTAPLIKAVNLENAEVLDAILEETDVNLENVIIDKEEGLNIFQISIGAGNIDLARVLLSHGDNIDKLTDFGESPLRLALNTEMPEAAEFLLINGCDVYTDSFIVKMLQKSMNKQLQQGNSHNSDDDEDTQTESDYTDDEENLDPNFLQWMHNFVSCARSLKLICLVAIRKYFREHRISFRKVRDLPVAEPLKLAIRYQNT